MKTEPTFADQLDVDNVLHLGLARYLSHGEKHGQDGRLATKVVVELSTMDEFCTSRSDRDYLHGIRLVVLSLGEGLAQVEARRREAFSEADAYKAAAIARIRSMHAQSFYSTMASRLLMFGGIGFLVAGTFVPALQSHLPKAASAREGNGDFALNVSTIAAIVFAAGSQVVKSRLDAGKDEKVNRHYEWLRMQAQKRYLQSKVIELENHRDRAVFLWKRYTGQQETPRVSLLTSVREELTAHNGDMKARQKMTTSMLSSALERLRTWRRGKHAQHNQTTHGGKAHA